MNKWIRRGAVALAALSALAGAAVVTGTQLATRKMERRIDVAVAPVAYRDDETALERGRYLFKSRGCVDCHGANGAGRQFMNDGKGLVLAAPSSCGVSAGAIQCRQSCMSAGATLRRRRSCRASSSASV